MSVRKPTVSILIPTYNRPHYVGAAIRSALAQTYAPIEVLVLDDAGTQDTRSVVAQWNLTPNLRYVRHPQNKGIAENWRAGITLCESDFFCLLHDDDTLEPGFIAELLAPLLENQNLILSFCDHWCMNAEGRRLPEATQGVSQRFGRDRLPPGKLQDFARTALVDTSIPIGATLFRSSLVTPDMIDSRAKGSIDMWLLYRCWQTGKGAWYVPTRLMNYRDHSGGMSASQPFTMSEGHLFRYAQMLADPNLAPMHADIQRMRAHILCEYGIDLMAAGQLTESRRALRESLLLRRQRRALFGYALSLLGKTGQAAIVRARQHRRQQVRELC